MLCYVIDVISFPRFVFLSFFFSQKVLCRTRILKTIATLLLDQYYLGKQPQVVTLKGAHSLEFCAMTPNDPPSKLTSAQSHQTN